MWILNIVMFVLPPTFAWMIHNYLRHGDMGIKRKVFFFFVYMILINMCTFGISCLRGVKGIRFSDMTFSYRLKYLGFGCIIGFVIPFIVCLLTEDQITLGGFKRYANRFLNDVKKYFNYSVRSAKADLRSEAASSYLNWLWWLIEPCCMMMIYKVPVTMNVLYSVPIILVLFLFTFGVGTILMHYGVYVNDLGYITGIVLSMLMYFTGTFYSIAKRIPEPFGEILEVCNPVAFLIASMRDALLYGQAPSWELLILWGFISLILIALGAFTIYSNENAYVKVI